MLQFIQRILCSLGHRAVCDNDLVADDLQKLARVLKEVG
jgi:hypothetical protein